MAFLTICCSFFEVCEISQRNHQQVMYFHLDTLIWCLSLPRASENADLIVYDRAQTSTWKKQTRYTLHLFQSFKL